MYGKVFESMFDGTLASKGPWQALVTFQQMIVLADQDGFVDMTADAIARRTSIPLEIIETGIEALSKPDPKSRTPDEEGRRIVPLEDHRDWGWKIVNHAKYASIRKAEERREYLRVKQAERRSKLKASTPVNNVNRVSAEINTSTDKDTDKDEDKVISKASPSQGAGKPSPAVDEGRFPEFWSAWPKSDRKQDRKKCLAKWRALNLDANADRIVAHVGAMSRTKKWLDGFDPLVLTYLNGERWQDPIPPDRQEPEAKTTFTRDKEAQASRWMGEFGKKQTTKEVEDAPRLTLD